MSLLPDEPAPLLVVHDGGGLAQSGSLLSWASAHAVAGPIRVALLDPAPGCRDAWYSANTEYLDHLAGVVLPRAPRPDQRVRGRRARCQSWRGGHDHVAAATPDGCRSALARCNEPASLTPVLESPGIRLPPLRPNLRRGGRGVRATARASRTAAADLWRD